MCPDARVAFRLITCAARVWLYFALQNCVLHVTRSPRCTKHWLHKSWKWTNKSYMLRSVVLNNSGGTKSSIGSRTYIYKFFFFSNVRFIYSISFIFLYRLYCAKFRVSNMKVKREIMKCAKKAIYSRIAVSKHNRSYFVFSCLN